MEIWVDADACPKPVKEILFRAAERAQVTVTLVSNSFLRLPESPFLRFLMVEAGPGGADDEIARRCAPGDLVITADIPLAARVVEKGVRALDPRGRMYDENNIKQILSMRDFMDSMRGSGLETGGPGGYGGREKQLFANELDRFLAGR
ncbi:MAG: YaiI/YqxD family protein [Alphaproteobacteria bacterium]|nr:YaiI/YqxD family protein [Alphaproteobacteria bacterium]